MTALLEFKQKIKGIYAQYEMYLLPLLKFVLALVYFIWINTNMGYMTALDNIFVVLILSLICCILPSGMMIFAGFALMVGHCYALGIEVAAFLLVLILFMMILFLRFSSGKISCLCLHHSHLHLIFRCCFRSDADFSAVRYQHFRQLAA